MSHRHHIVPKHRGGSEDPFNKTTVTVERHAHLHHMQYKRYGHEENRLAWQGLTGIISHEEVIRQLAAIRAKRVHTGRKRGPITLQKMRDNHKGMTGRKATEAHKQAIADAMKGKPSPLKGRNAAPRPASVYERIAAANRGKERTTEAKMKMAIKRKEYWANKRATEAHS